MEKADVFVSKGSGLRVTPKGGSCNIVEVEQEAFRRPQTDLEELIKKTQEATGGK